jgi:hypothetical protein
MFNANWSATVIKKIGNRFHNNFTVGLKAHPLLYKGANLGYGIQIQREVTSKEIIQMRIKGHVATRVQ